VNELALFAGAGGGVLAGHQLGWRCVCAVERDAYCAQVLVQRQNDGALPAFPVWSEVQSFDGRPWRGLVDVVSGGFPCQDISLAGKGAGIDGERSGLWNHMARIVGEVRPEYVFVENSAALLVRGLGRVLGDLAALGYDARWTVLGAGDVGAPHRRDRLWIVAHADIHPGDQRWASDAEKDPRGWESHRSDKCADVSYADGGRCEEFRLEKHRGVECACGNQPDGLRAIGWRHGTDGADAGGARLAPPQCEDVSGTRRRDEGRAVAEFRGWQSEPDVGRVADGVAHRVDRLRALGNGQVPLCAATAWRMLKGAGLIR